MRSSSLDRTMSEPWPLGLQHGWHGSPQKSTMKRFLRNRVPTDAEEFRRCPGAEFGDQLLALLDRAWAETYAQLPTLLLDAEADGRCEPEGCVIPGGTDVHADTARH